MVFTSLPIYHLDPPNWNQPNQQQSTIVPITESSHLLMSQQPPMNNSNQNPNGGGSRPGSMAERARLAKIPQPEPALKCPRCDSTNTKFCYFNNYSLSQPRHFCKTCRRYWTRGGALRSVPVGGGCRRNKRSSSKSGNKSGSSAAAAASSSSSCSTATSGSGVIPPNFSPFMSSLHHPVTDQYHHLGLNFMQQQQQQMDHAGDYQLEQWRMQQIQQFPFLGGLDASQPVNPVNTGIYNPNFDGDQGGGELGFNHVASKVVTSSTSGLITQLASVKMEDSNHAQLGLSLQRQYLGMPGNDQYIGGGWGAGDLSGFNSASSGNVL